MPALVVQIYLCPTHQSPYKSTSRRNRAGLFAQSLYLEKMQSQSNFWHCSPQSAVWFLTMPNSNFPLTSSLPAPAIFSTWRLFTMGLLKLEDTYKLVRCCFTLQPSDRFLPCSQRLGSIRFNLLHFMVLWIWWQSSHKVHPSEINLPVLGFRSLKVFRSLNVFKSLKVFRQLQKLQTYPCGFCIACVIPMIACQLHKSLLQIPPDACCFKLGLYIREKKPTKTNQSHFSPLAYSIRHLVLCWEHNTDVLLCRSTWQIHC